MKAVVMHLDDSRLPLIFGLWAAVITVLVFVIVAVTIGMTRKRLSQLTGLALVLGAVVSTTIVGWLWITSSQVNGYSCLMSDSLSSALASAPESAVDRGCMRDGRIRIALGVGVEVALVGLTLAAVRPKASNQHPAELTGAVR